MGTFNSGCAKIIVPVLNRANPGPVAMVSPANTSPGLTTDGPGAEPGEPDKYYPTGTRNYARVVANDQIQGPADAQFAKDIGLKKIFILNDKQTYGFGVATTFKGAAPKLGLQVAGFQGWDAKQSSYEALANTIKQSGADGIFLGGIICNNGAKLIKDLKAGVPDATIIAPDGFSDPKSNGAAFDDSYVSVAGQPPTGLKGEGKTFVTDFGAQIGATPNPYSQYGAQAMLVMLDAIAKATDMTRADGRQEPLRPGGEERDHRRLHAQRQGRHEPGPDHDLPAEGGEAEPAEDHRSCEEPDLLGTGGGGKVDGAGHLLPGAVAMR